MDPPPPLPTVTMDDGSSIPMSSVWPPWYQGENVTPNIGRLMEALDAERLDIARVLGVDVRTIYEHFSWSFGVPMEIPVDDASDEEGRGDEVDENDDDDDGPNDDVESSAMESKTTPRTGRTMSSSSTATTSRTRPLSVSEMNQMMRHRLNNDVLGPVTPDTRYVLEDVPFGLVPTVLLGRLAGRPATLHECGIRILSAMYGRDFMMENDLLAGLGLLSAVTSDDGGDRVHDEIDDIPSLDRWREMAYTGSFRR
jgi:opine dehydrogenase